MVYFLNELPPEEEVLSRKPPPQQPELRLRCPVIALIILMIRPEE